MIAIIDYDRKPAQCGKSPAFTGGNACHNQGQENDTQSDKVILPGWDPLAMPWESWSSMVWWM